MNRCVFCGIAGIGYGNNAQPLNPGRCCDTCNALRVIPYRLGLLASKKNDILTQRRGEEE